jgi:hypothetical protein
LWYASIPYYLNILPPYFFRELIHHQSITENFLLDAEVYWLPWAEGAIATLQNRAVIECNSVQKNKPLCLHFDRFWHWKPCYYYIYWTLFSAHCLYYIHIDKTSCACGFCLCFYHILFQLLHCTMTMYDQNRIVYCCKNSLVSSKAGCQIYDAMSLRLWRHTRHILYVTVDLGFWSYIVIVQCKSWNNIW